MSWEGQPRLTRVNIRIKVVISIVLKFELGKYQGHKFGGSTRVDLIFFLNQSNLILTNKIKKKNWLILTHALSQVNLSFWLG
jgi:hypothetical protein